MLQQIIMSLLLLSFPIYMTSQKVYTPEILLGKGGQEFFGDGYQLQKEAHTAFLRLCQSAKKAGFDIKVVSSYRSYEHQNRIWERKYKKFTSQGLSPIQAINKIIEYSTIPGTSRHHWGTDLDLVDGNAPQPTDVLLAENFHNDGPFCKFKEWMDEYANSYGFYLVYTNQKDRKGFKYEPWHYSYRALSKPMLQAYKKLDIKTMLQQQKLLGSIHFSEDFIQHYISKNILDINPILRN